METKWTEGPVLSCQTACDIKQLQNNNTSILLGPISPMVQEVFCID
jgi:hypothetical protein